MRLPFEETLRAAKNGEAWAWEDIFRNLAPSLTGYAALRGAREPDEVASETMYHVARGIHSFEGSEESFRSWAFVIAHRKLIDARRSAGRKVEQTQIAGDFADKTSDPESAALNRIELDEMQALLVNLSADQQTVIALRMIADLSLAETAKVMGKNVGSVKALQRRALENLRRELEARGVSR